MPVLVDHEKTRQQITEIAGDIVATEGISALTSRRMAEAAGASRAIVNTYFRDMRDLVIATFRNVTTRQGQRYDAALTSGGGLEVCIDSLLPMDDARLRDWRITLAFIGVALTDADLYEIERTLVDSAVDRFDKLVASEHGVRRSTRTRQAAQHIVSSIIGVSTHYCFHSNTVPSASERKQMVRSVLVGIDL